MLNEDPLVSVIILAFQHVDFISRCIESALMQKTLFQMEILIGEDESVDGTREICEEYKKRFPDKIRLFLRSRKDVININGRPTGRFNFIKCVEASRGRYIAFCEGDDYWTDPNKLQKQVDFLESNPDCVACHHWQEIAEMGASGEFAIKEAPRNGQGYLAVEKSGVEKIFTNELRIKSRTVMFRNVLTEFPEWFYKVAYGDVPLTMLLGKYGDFGFINEPMAVYRQTGKGVSALGRENWLFTYNQYIEWIKIWEYGNQHYADKYIKETLVTIFYFYKVIFEKYKYSSSVFYKMIKYALFESKLSVINRIRIFFGLFRYFLAGRKKRMLDRL
jgi:glycosyltransferase involved in cell wall biosynthesis